MVDDFVRIASYTNVWEAELARSRLADEQIRAFLGNAMLVSWFWHYSNAVGGVTVHVARRDAEVARHFVTLIRTNPAQRQPSWKCPRCNATLLESWTVCWQCGASTDGSEALRCAEDEPVSEPVLESKQTYGSSIFAVTVAIVLMALLSGGLLFTLAVMPFVALFIILLQAIGGETAAQPMSDGSKEPGPTSSGAPTPKQSRVANAIVMRARRAAVLGFFMFPPLGLYSLWLVRRLAARSMRLDRNDYLRCGVAVMLDLWAILLGLLLLALPLLVLSYSFLSFLLTSFGSQYFDFCR
jgi:hypothetical protein